MARNLASSPAKGQQLALGKGSAAPPGVASRPAPPRLSRGAFLRWTARVAGAGVVVLAAGTTWRALDQGVFASGQGPAYQAWRDWPGSPGEGLLALVRSAVLAANAHDTQPWLFVLGSDRIDLFVDVSRNIGTVDPLRRDQHISLGCALENLTLAARATGFSPAVTLIPDPGDVAHVARVDLRPATPDVSPLFSAIPLRHTDRSAYDTRRPVAGATLAALAAVNDQPDVRVVWLTDDLAKQHFGDLTVRATAAIVADPEQAADDFAWYRLDWHELQRRKDGITMDTAGLSGAMSVLVKILPAQSRATNQDGWVAATRDQHVATAAAFGLILARDGRDVAQRLRVGQLWQRLHLFATTQGLAMQPLNQVIERAEREETTGLEPTSAPALRGLLPEPGWQAMLAFRVGYPTKPPALSPRRPAEEVTRRASP